MINKLHFYQRTLNWIYYNTVEGNGIAVTSKKHILYPEVSGYYIPTLMMWGERELAVSFTKHLCSIQKDDGSWYDSSDKEPYIFDSSQILKGLISVREILPEVDKNIIKGCNWILSNMHPDGRLATTNENIWENDEDFYSELIHIYCLSPIRDAGKIFNKPEYVEAADKILAYYIKEKRERIENFSLLSHFYAYVMEGLFDMGQIDLCRDSMMRLEKYRNRKGGIPGLKDVPWICSTGLFQLALVWYKLGDLARGNSLFYYAISLQNESGGWFGSYPAPSFFARFYRGRNKPFYFPDEEISWANKYFLDALAYKEKLEFEKQSPNFLDKIDQNDGRYLLIRNLLQNSEKPLKICDVGCGKGRYLKRLAADLPGNKYFAMDISADVMKSVECVEEKRLGTITNIPYQTNSFDLVYCCEAFEHAINIRGAFKELCRITKNGGKFVIIDKPFEKLGQLEIYEWEQWIKDEDMKSFASECHCDLEIVPSVPYENKDDGLFRAWIVTKK